MKILLVSASFDVRFGGPAFSVSRLALALVHAAPEARVALWAPDGSAQTSTVIKDHPRLQRLAGTLSCALSDFQPHVVHDNGIWLPHNHLLARWAKKNGVPRVVSIRGMLEPWARNHKQLKKTLAWWLYQRNDLRIASCLHVTSKEEGDNLQKYELGVSVKCIPNGVDMPDMTAAATKKRKDLHVGSRSALFLSRIHPKKGLPMLVEAWGRAKPHGWTLTIAGPDEAGHRAEVERLVKLRGLSSEIFFVGPVRPEERHALFAASELFILPTHSENFGMVIGEALAHAVPVLTTKGAPWAWLEKEGAGWWVDISVEGLTDGLRKATTCNRDQLLAMGRRGQEYVLKQYSWNRIAEQFLTIYEEISS